MAPKSANNLDPYSRAAFLAAQVDSLLSNKSHPASLPNPHPGEVAPNNPKKRSRAASPRSAAVTDAKKLLRAATAVDSKSLAIPSPRCTASEAAPQFVHRPPDVSRHRRKCSVCRHPEREAIEDLFIHWHSPNSIANYYSEGEESDITWVSIYRHAYAFGLDEIRRRNLRFAFELILEQAGDITATPAAITASARALGSCVDSNGQWNEPPRRVIVTNIIRNEQLDGGASHAFVEADRFHRPAPSAMNDSSSAGAVVFVGPDGSYRAEGVHSTPPVPAGAIDDAEVRDFFSASASSPEIRNSPNSFKSKEPPISNR